MSLDEADARREPECFAIESSFHKGSYLLFANLYAAGRVCRSLKQPCWPQTDTTLGKADTSQVFQLATAAGIGNNLTPFPGIALSIITDSQGHCSDPPFASRVRRKPTEGRILRTFIGSAGDFPERIFLALSFKKSIRGGNGQYRDDALYNTGAMEW